LAIVGLNGAGKTTLVKLLLRLYKPTEGKITLDGLDIWEIPYKRYTQIISVVLQDFALFAYSIKENILFDKSYDPVALTTALKKADLRAKFQNFQRGLRHLFIVILMITVLNFPAEMGRSLQQQEPCTRTLRFSFLMNPLQHLTRWQSTSSFHGLAKLQEEKLRFLLPIGFHQQHSATGSWCLMKVRLLNRALMRS